MIKIIVCGISFFLCQSVSSSRTGAALSFFSVSLAPITFTVGHANCKNVDEAHGKLVMPSSSAVAGMTLSCLGSS